MKRFLIFVPIVFLILLNACNDPGSLPASFSDPQLTQVSSMLTARVLTPTFTPTVPPRVSNIVMAINEGLNKLDDLELSLDGRYYVGNVIFQQANWVDYYMEIDVLCVRAYNNTQPCNRFQTFIKIIQAMKVNKDAVMKEVPNTVQSMYVTANDNGTQLTPVYANWSDVVNYMNGNISGYELGYRVSQINNAP